MRGFLHFQRYRGLAAPFLYWDGVCAMVSAKENWKSGMAKYDMRSGCMVPAPDSASLLHITPHGSTGLVCSWLCNDSQGTEHRFEVGFREICTTL